MNQLLSSLSSTRSSPPKNNTPPALEKQIDEMVCTLYGLTEEEIAIVEEKK